MYVFDTSILVAGLRSRRGASFVILQALQQRLIRGAASTALLLEYSDVLTRDENLQQFWASADEIDVILGVLASLLKPTPIHYRWRPQLNDPNDELVLECAINAQARAIITFNIRDFLPATNQFQIELIQPSAFIQQLNLVERLQP